MSVTIVLALTSPRFLEIGLGNFRAPWSGNPTTVLHHRVLPADFPVGRESWETPPSCGQLGSSLFPPIRKKDPQQYFPNPPKAPASWNHPSLPQPARPRGTTETPQGLSLVTFKKKDSKKTKPWCIYSESDRKNPFSLLHALTGIHD